MWCAPSLKGSTPSPPSIPDYDLFKGKTEEQIKETFVEVAKINRMLPSFKQIHHIEIKSGIRKDFVQKIIRYKV